MFTVWICIECLHRIQGAGCSVSSAEPEGGEKSVKD